MGILIVISSIPYPDLVDYPILFILALVRACVNFFARGHVQYHWIDHPMLFYRAAAVDYQILLISRGELKLPGRYPRFEA